MGVNEPADQAKQADKGPVETAQLSQEAGGALDRPRAHLPDMQRESLQATKSQEGGWLAFTGASFAVLWIGGASA